MYLPYLAQWGIEKEGEERCIEELYVGNNYSFRYNHHYGKKERMTFLGGKKRLIHTSQFWWKRGEKGGGCIG